jgi:hypothetical protein
MASGVIAAVTALLGLLSIVLEAWCKAKPQRVEEQRDEEAIEQVQTERGRLSVNDGPGVDAAVAAQHDRVRLALGGGDPGGRDDHGAEGDVRRSLLGQRGAVEGAETVQGS